MRRPQFTLRALLVLMLAAGCFFGGIHFERERRRREDEANAVAGQIRDLPLLLLPDESDWVIMGKRVPTSQAQD